jgi:PAS domain S-box-containing protein
LSELRWLIDRVETGYLVAMYGLGIGSLAWAYRTASSRLIAKQRLWLLASAAAGLGPFTAFYGIPYFLGTVPSPWMNLSALSLVLLPLGMAYTVARHRLLDVEVALRRGTAYSLATAALVGLYLAIVALAGDFFLRNFPRAGTVGLVLAVIATGLLFQPLQRWIQLRVDRHFSRKRTDYREALLRLGRQLSTQTNLDHMVSSLLEQLAETLRIERAALFVRSDGVADAWMLRGAVGLESVRSPATDLDLSYLDGFERASSLPAERRERLFFPDWGTEVPQGLGATSQARPGWQLAIRRLELNYYFPCRTPSRLTAVLALGRTSGGELLSEEDVALVELLAGYVGAAIENVSLFESLTAKAKQYEDLQQFSENILESINVGLMAVDLEDRVQSVNTPLELMYPLPFRQCRGRKLEEIFSGELMAEISRSREDAGIRTLYRHCVQLEGGQEKVLNIAIAPLLSKNCEWIGRLIIFDDVTDRVNLETQLAQAEKLSSIGLLAAGVAHEVNTPLTVISTQAQMLAKEMPRDGTNFRTVEKIIRQTFRASEIVNSLLNFSRTKGAAFAPVELNQIIQDTLLLLEHQLQSAHVGVERHLEPGLPLIHGNTDKLQQVFLNLFLNAKDAMPEGGQLRITSWTEDSRVRIEVRDTGLGISPEHLRRIYDPFFTTKEPGRGTGLGLAVSYGIVHEHAGRIQVESRPGLGTRFELEFPALRKPVHA